MYMKLNIMVVIIQSFILFIGIAYLTLLERKILGYIQDRKGPNKVGFMGILQPFSEAIKLFSKEDLEIMKTSKVLFYLMPVLSMFCLLIVWMIYPYFTNVYYMNYSILYMIVILSLNSYVIMLMGWSSNSLYAMFGSIRSVAQLLSYEVVFILIILVQMILSESYSLLDFIKWQVYLWYMVMLFPLMIMFFISMLAELNRSPMDFIEGESELVSGFNVEYFSGLFALIFLVEYGMIIFMSFFMVYMYMGSESEVVKIFLVNLMISVVIFMRGILPRMRYDEMMYLCWKIFLPLVLNYLIYILMFKFMVSILV
uniref:NADH dehydrogenase subunit 1 n=1 Tax=Buniapone amblyops TaxID=613574 RepID=UPI002A82B4B3|nr:NADH dehydrogenase subunit 1 [Buniapone amblyops]WON66609.1 NADH dehydrogenase subunit 1 [Buniapone amblyops]